MKFLKRRKKANSNKIERKDALHKHPFAVVFGTLFVLSIGSFGTFLYAGGQTVEDEDVKRVQVYFDGQAKTLPTRAKTVSELLTRLNITLQPEDIVEPGPNTPILNDDFSINIYRARPVTVIDESGKKVVAKIAESTADGIAKKAGFSVYPEDNIEFADPTLAVQDGVIGELVTIDRALRASINLYGNNIEARTHAKTVGDLLNEKNIKEIQGDNILPSKDTPIIDGIAIFVVPAGRIVDIREEIIPAPVETKLDATLDVNTSKVQEPGQDGKRVVVYELEIVDGVEKSRKEIQSLVSITPVKKVVVRGTKSAGFDGGFAAALAALRSCEGGYTSINYSGGYYGAYQFNLGTWAANAPAGYADVRPDQAPPAVQDQAASTLYSRRGWSPWPSCSRKLGLQDVYR